MKILEIWAKSLNLHMHSENAKQVAAALSVAAPLSLPDLLKCGWSAEAVL